MKPLYELSKDLQTIIDQSHQLEQKKRIILRKISRLPKLCSAWEQSLNQKFPNLRLLRSKGEQLFAVMSKAHRSLMNFDCLQIDSDEQVELANRYLACVRQLIKANNVRFPIAKEQLLATPDPTVSAVKALNGPLNKPHTWYTFAGHFSVNIANVLHLKQQLEENISALIQLDSSVVNEFHEHFSKVLPEKKQVFQTFHKVQTACEQVQDKVDDLLAYQDFHYREWLQEIRFVNVFEIQLQMGIFQVPVEDEDAVIHMADAATVTALMPSPPITPTTLPPPPVAVLDDSPVNNLPLELGEQQDWINSFLADELLLKLFNHLPILDRIRLRRVCRRWHPLTLDGISELFIGFWQERGVHRLAIPALNRIYVERGEYGRTLDAFDCLIKHVGPGLTKLQINQWNMDKSFEKRLLTMMDTLAHLCPNLVSIDFGIEQLDCFSIKRLLQPLGNRLEQVYVATTDEGNFLHLLNPQKLQKLSIKTTVSVDFIGQQFPLLTELVLFNDRPLDTQRILSLSPRLRSLCCGQIMTAPSDGLFGDPKIYHQLDQLGIFLNEMMSSEFLQNFTQLRRLRLEYLSEDVNRFDFIFHLKGELDELALLNHETSYSSIFLKPKQRHLNLIPVRLNRLRKLVFHDIPIDWLLVDTWTPMPRLTWLDFFDYKYFSPIESEMKLFSCIPQLFPNLRVLNTYTHYIGAVKVKASIGQLHQLAEVNLLVPNRLKAHFLALLKPYCDDKNIALYIQGYDEWKTHYPPRRASAFSLF